MSESFAEKVFVTAEVQAKAEFADEVRRQCLALVEPSRREPGCLSYELFQSTHNLNLFIFFECWQTREDLERHLESPHALGFDEKTIGMLVQPEKILYLEKIDSNI
jgi:quinol monooxygenase YgiN